MFDLMECSEMNDVGRFLLNAVDVRQTPVVEIWDDGQLVTFQTGLPMTHKVLQNAGLLK